MFIFIIWWLEDLLFSDGGCNRPNFLTVLSPIVPRLMKSFLPQPEAPAAAAAGVPPAGAAKGRRNNNASRIEEIKEEAKKEN